MQCLQRMSRYVDLSSTTCRPGAPCLSEIVSSGRGSPSCCLDPGFCDVWTTRTFLCYPPMITENGLYKIAAKDSYQ